MADRILVVSHDKVLRQTRSALLKKHGYSVETADGVDNALDAMLTGAFDLVLVGRNSLSDKVPIDQRLRERYPNLLILKIVDLIDQHNSYSSHMTNSVPENVIAALKGMLA